VTLGFCASFLRSVHPGPSIKSWVKPSALGLLQQRMNPALLLGLPCLFVANNPATPIVASTARHTQFPAAQITIAVGVQPAEKRRAIRPAFAVAQAQAARRTAGAILLPFRYPVQRAPRRRRVFRRRDPSIVVGVHLREFVLRGCTRFLRGIIRLSRLANRVGQTIALHVRWRGFVPNRT